MGPVLLKLGLYLGKDVVALQNTATYPGALMWNRKLEKKVAVPLGVRMKKFPSNYSPPGKYLR